MREDRTDLLAGLSVRGEHVKRSVRVMREDAQQFGAGVTGRAQDADPNLIRARSHEPLLSSTNGNPQKERAPRRTPLIENTPMPAGSALRELEATSGLGLAVFLALDDAAIARQEALRLERRPQTWLVIEQRLGDAVTHRAGLARETAADHRAVHVELAEAIDDGEGLVDQHAQHGAREIDRAVAAIDRDLAGAGLHPDARDGVFALAGR